MKWRRFTYTSDWRMSFAASLKPIFTPIFIPCCCCCLCCWWAHIESFCVCQRPSLVKTQINVVAVAPFALSTLLCSVPLLMMISLLFLFLLVFFLWVFLLAFFNTDLLSPPGRALLIELLMHCCCSEKYQLSLCSAVQLFLCPSVHLKGYVIVFAKWKF